MSLPYGTNVLGFTPSWCYEHIRDQLADFKNTYGIESLKGREDFFIGYEELDPRVFETPHLPAAVIQITDCTFGESPRRGADKTIYDSGTIAHVGTGTGNVTLSGQHRGNARFILEITETGYELRQTPWTGSDWGTEEIVSSGAIPDPREIPCGNGQTFVVGSGDTVVGDTYSWETQAYRVSHILGRTMTLAAKIEIYFWKPVEQTWAAHNPLDQMFLWFNNKGWRIPVLGGDSVDVEEELVGLRAFQKTFEVAQGEGVETSIHRAHAIELRLRYRGPEAGRDPTIFIAEVQSLMQPAIDEVKIPES